MKKTVLKSSIFAGLMALLMLIPWFSGVQKTALADISKPHLGRYECQTATLGDKNLLSRFSYINLELETEKDFTLYYREKEGKAKQTHGHYKYDKTKGTISLKGLPSLIFKREFSLKEGVLTIVSPLRDKTLIMRFVQV